MAEKLVTRIREGIRRQPLTAMSLVLTLFGWILTSTGVLKPFFEVKIAVQPLSLFQISTANSFVMLTSGTAFFIVSAVLAYVLFKGKK